MPRNRKLSSAEKARNRARRKRNASAAKQHERARVALLTRLQRKAQKEKRPVAAAAIGLEREVLRRFGRTKKARSHLRNELQLSRSERRRAAVSMALWANGERRALDEVISIASSTRDAPLQDECLNFIQGTAGIKAIKKENVKAPGGFIHTPVGREKGWDYV